MRIRSISIRGMWSFDDDGIEITDLSKHNVFVGKNNSGKSNVLRALRLFREHKNGLQENQRFAIGNIDLFEQGDAKSSTNPCFLIEAEPELADVPHIMNTAASQLPNSDERALFERVLQRGMWLGFDKFEASSKTVEPRFDFVQPPDEAEFAELKTADRTVKDQEASWNAVRLRCGKVCVERLADGLRYVSGWRQLRGPTDTNEQIIQLLHEWKSPTRENRQLQRKFERVQDLFRNLMQNRSLTLEPEYTGNNLHIKWNKRYLPIDSFGDGVHHLLIIAFYLATQPESHLLIEEPETHLHPESLRNLMALLKQELKGQSFITTHSPVLLDTDIPTQVYRIEHDGCKSNATSCHKMGDFYKILDQLDVRASDLLQANIVIWVEGPTDRMFLKQCLTLRDSQWTEGLHYQFAYYGGSLLSHVTVGKETERLVDLLRLCRNIVVVCDSDRTKEEEDLNESKTRIGNEVESVEGLFWVTAGREIENYIPDSALTRTYQRLLGQEDVQLKLGRFDRLEDVISDQISEAPRGSSWALHYARNKVRVMQELLSDLRSDELDHLDLADRLQEIEDSIAQANQAMATNPDRR